MFVRRMSDGEELATMIPSSATDEYIIQCFRYFSRYKKEGNADLLSSNQVLPLDQSEKGK
jgi:hypothetical protein